LWLWLFQCSRRGSLLSHRCRFPHVRLAGCVYSSDLHLSPFALPVDHADLIAAGPADFQPASPSPGGKAQEAPRPQLVARNEIPSTSMETKSVSISSLAAPPGIASAGPAALGSAADKSPDVYAMTRQIARGEQPALDDHDWHVSSLCCSCFGDLRGRRIAMQMCLQAASGGGAVLRAPRFRGQARAVIASAARGGSYII
jgi:hypothetical protein